MKNYFINNTIFRLIAPLVYGVLLYLLILLINNNIQHVKDIFVTEELYVCIGLSYLSFEAVRQGILGSNKLLADRSGALLITCQLLITTALSVSLVLVSLMIYFKYIVGFTISVTQLKMFAVIFGLTSLVYNVMYLSHYFLYKENSVKLEAEKQQRTVLEMEMLEYRNDINPDLLYESLECLIPMMYNNIGKAEDYIDSLGTAYRYVLTNRENEMVPIREELTACRNMIALLNEKYSSQLVLQSSVEEDDIDGMLIPGSLPVIAEYLVRNSIITMLEPFVIRLYMEEEYLTIETRLNDRLIAHAPTELAFARLQRSYSLYTELPLIKVKAYEQNYIKLPVLRIGEEIGGI